MKRSSVVMIILLFISSALVSQESGGLLEETVRAQLEELDLGHLLSFSEYVEREYQSSFPPLITENCWKAV